MRHSLLLCPLPLELGELADVELAVAVLVERPEGSGQPNIIYDKFSVQSLP